MVDSFSFQDALGKPQGQPGAEPRKPFSFGEAAQPAGSTGFSFGEATGQPAEPGFFQKQVGQPLEQSYQSQRQGSGVTGAKAYQDRLAIFDQIDKAQKEGGSVAVQRITDLYPDPEIKQYGLFGIAHPDKQQEMRKQYEEYIQAGTEKSAAGTKALEAMPVDPALQELANKVNKGDWWGVGGYLLENPGILTRAALGSTLQSAQGVAMAPVLGPAGVGLADMGTQMQSSLVDTMQAAGVNMKDPKAIREALLDPHLMAEARRKMAAMGLPILAFDTLTAGIAGRALLPAKAMEKTLGKVEELALQTGVQAAGGGAGEAVGQLASAGKITDPTSVLLNTLAEIPGGAPEALALGAVAGKYTKGPDTKAPMADAELNSLFQGTGEEILPTVTAEGVILRPGLTEKGVEKAATEMRSSEQQNKFAAAEREGILQSIAGELTAPAAPHETPEATLQRLVVARKMPNGQVVYGQPGQVHSDLLGPIEKITSLESTGPQMGFAIPGGEFMTRDQALQYARTNTPSESLGTSKAEGGIGLEARNYNFAMKVSPEIQAAMEAVKGGVTPPTTTVAQRVASLPATGEILAQTPGVSGTQEALVYARQAARMRDEVARFTAENQPGPAAVAQQAAEKYMQQAEAKGFTFTTQGEAARLESVKRGMTSVGAIAKGKTTATPQAMLTTPGTIFTQNPEFYQNPIEGLKANLPARFPQVGPNLYTVGEHPNLGKAVKFVRSLASRIMPGMKLVIDTRPDSGFALPGMGASYTGFKGNYGVISLHPSVLENEALTTAAITHELGHAIVHYHWASTPTDQQQAIYAAFGRHLMEVFGPDATAGMFLDDLHSPFALATMQRIYQSKLQQGSVEFLKESQYASWYSFDEWIAEQASKWMFTNRRTVTLMDRFFKSIGDAMEKVLKMVGRGLPSFSPPAEVKSWLNSMLERRVGAEMPLTVPGALEQYRKGVEENAKALGVPPGLNVVPPQAETIPLRSLAMNLPGIFSKKDLAESDRWGYFAKYGTQVIQWAANNPHIEGAQTYLESARYWSNTKMQIAARAVGRLREWGKLGKEMSNQLGKFIFDIDSMSYLTPSENPRHPTTPELALLAKKHKINREAVELYMKIKGDFSYILDRVEAAWVKDAAKSFAGDPLRLSLAISQIRADIGQMQARPYFPHERFGKWTVKVREKGKLVHFSTRPTEKEAIRLARSLQKENPSLQVSSGKLPEEMEVYQGLPPSLIRDLVAKMPNVTKDQLQAAEELAFASSPANSFSKKFIRRKGTLGFSMDAKQVYATYFLHAGSHIARLEEGQNLRDSIQRVRDSANAMVGVEAASVAGERMGLADGMKRHFEYIMNPPNEWTGLRGVGFFYYMWGNVSSALLNLVQIPMFTFPYLSTRFGTISTTREMTKASLDIHKWLGSGMKLSPEEYQAISLGREHNFLTESLATELAGMGQGGVMQRILPGTQVQRKIMDLLWYGAWGFQAVEEVNRHGTFVAAFRLGQQKPDAPHLAALTAANPRLYNELISRGWSPTNASAWLGARDAVDKSQFEYSQFARPEFVRGKKGVVFAFAMWKQNALWFMKNDPGRLRAITIMLAFAGLAGMPFAGDLNDLIRYMSSLVGKDFNAEQELRHLLVELKVNPDLVLHGAGHESFGLSWAGDQLGIPIPNVDVSQRLGMGRVVPGLQEFAAPGGNFYERLGRGAEAASGAIYSIPIRMLKAAESNDPREWHKLQQFLPMAFKNFAKAMDVAEQGGMVTQGGANIAKFDTTDVKSQAELVAMALGFNPTRVSKAWDELRAKQEAIAYWTTRRGVLFQQFADARFAHDREGIADAREAIKEFNRTAPDGRLKISASELVQSLQSRQRRNIAIEKGRAGSAPYEGVAKEIRKNYP